MDKETIEGVRKQNQALNKWMQGYLKKKDGRSCSHPEKELLHRNRGNLYYRCKQCKRRLTEKTEEAKSVFGR